VFDALLAGGHEHVLLERGDALIVSELGAAVVGLGRLGKNVDDDHGLDQRVIVFGVKFGAAAHDGEVRIGEESRGRHVNALVARQDDTRLRRHKFAQTPTEVHRDQVVNRRGAGHRDDFAIHELVLCLRGAFERYSTELTRCFGTDCTPIV
jgi:hypothetical protein